MIDVLVTVLVLTTSDINLLVRELDEITSDYLATGFAYVYFEPVSKCIGIETVHCSRRVIISEFVKTCYEKKPCLQLVFCKRILSNSKLCSKRKLIGIAAIEIYQFI